MNIIEAAGGILWRKSDSGNFEVALIHRPRYDDWTFPKGKVDSGETHLAAAFREVKEETGYTAIFGPEIGEISYEVDGNLKLVKYWAARAVGNNAGPLDASEVDQMVWLNFDSAREKLSNDEDRTIWNLFITSGFDSKALIFLRHAKAVKREDWDGDDGDRPLDSLGQVQAEKMAKIYEAYGIDEIRTSDAIRCVQTINPMKSTFGLPIIFAPEVSEYGFEKDRKASLEYAVNVMAIKRNSIICSHNPVIPKLTKKLIGKKIFKKLDLSLKPGDALILHHNNGDVVAIDWVGAPERLHI